MGNVGRREGGNLLLGNLLTVVLGEVARLGTRGKGHERPSETTLNDSLLERLPVQTLTVARGRELETRLLGNGHLGGVNDRAGDRVDLEGDTPVLDGERSLVLRVSGRTR